ncbi:transport and Golgi organization protein 1 homolog [Argonauta hians]
MSLANDAGYTVSNPFACRKTTSTTRNAITTTSSLLSLLFLQIESYQQMLISFFFPMEIRRNNIYRNSDIANGQFIRDHGRISPLPASLNFHLLLFLLLTISPICHVAALKQVSNLRLCADKECKETISYAKTIREHQAVNANFLQFREEQIIHVKSKGGGRIPYLWGGEANGQFGYFPKSLVKEIDILVPQPNYLVSTGQGDIDRTSTTESDDPGEKSDPKRSDPEQSSSQADNAIEDDTETTVEDSIENASTPATAETTTTETTTATTSAENVNLTQDEAERNKADSPAQNNQVDNGPDDETEISEDESETKDEVTKDMAKVDSDTNKGKLTKDEVIDQTADKLIAEMALYDLDKTTKKDESKEVTTQSDDTHSGESTQMPAHRSSIDSVQTSLLYDKEGHIGNSENDNGAGSKQEQQQQQEKQHRHPGLKTSPPSNEFHPDMSTSASSVVLSSSEPVPGHPHPTVPLNEASVYDTDPRSSQYGFDNERMSIAPTRSATYENTVLDAHTERAVTETDTFLHASNGNAGGHPTQDRISESMKLTSSSSGSAPTDDSSWVKATIPPNPGHQKNGKEEMVTKFIVSSSISYGNSAGDDGSNNDQARANQNINNALNGITQDKDNNIDSTGLDNNTTTTAANNNNNDDNNKATDTTMNVNSPPTHVDVSDAFSTSGSEFVSRKTLSISSSSTIAAGTSSISSNNNNNNNPNKPSADSEDGAYVNRDSSSSSSSNSGENTSHDNTDSSTPLPDLGHAHSKESHSHDQHQTNDNSNPSSSAWSQEGQHQGVSQQQQQQQQPPIVQYDHDAYNSDNQHHNHNHPQQHKEKEELQSKTSVDSTDEITQSKESSDHLPGSTNPDHSHDSWLSVWMNCVSKMDVFVGYLLESAPESVQSIILQQQYMLGIPAHVVILAPLISLVFLAIYFMCSPCADGGSKPKENPLSIIRNLEEKLFISTKETEILEDQLQSMSEKLAFMEDEARSQADSSGNFAVDLEQHKLENRKLKKEMETLVFQVSCMKDKLLDHSSVIEQKDDEIQSLSDELKEKLEKSFYEINTKTEEITTLQSQVQTMSDQIQHLEDRKEQLTQEVEGWHEKYQELSDSCEQSNADYSEMQERLAFKENELEQMKTCFLQLKCLEDDCSNSEDTRGDHNLVQQKIQQMLDVSEMNAMLKQSDEEREQLKHRLEIEAESRVELEEKIAGLERDIETIQADKAKVVRHNHELTVLTSYLKDKELQFQRALGEQEVLKNQNITKLGSAEERVKTIEDELSNYKQQNEDLKREILKADRDFRAQIAANEKKAHENWLATRCAERELKESRHECSLLRNKISDIERRQGPFPVPLIRPLATRNTVPVGLINGPPHMMEGDLHMMPPLMGCDLPMITPPGEVPHGRSPHLAAGASGNQRDDGLDGDSSSGHRPDSRSKGHHIRSPMLPPPPPPHLYRDGRKPPRVRGGPPPPHSSPMMPPKGLHNSPGPGPTKKGMQPPPHPSGEPSSTDGGHPRSPMSNKSPPPPVPMGPLPPGLHHLHPMHHMPPPPHPRMPGDARHPPLITPAHGPRGHPGPYNGPPRPTASQSSDSHTQPREKMPPRQHSQV